MKADLLVSEYSLLFFYSARLLQQTHYDKLHLLLLICTSIRNLACSTNRNYHAMTQTHGGTVSMPASGMCSIYAHGSVWVFELVPNMTLSAYTDVQLCLADLVNDLFPRCFRIGYDRRVAFLCFSLLISCRQYSFRSTLAAICAHKDSRFEHNVEHTTSVASVTSICRNSLRLAPRN